MASPVFVLLAFALVVAQFALPRRLAFLPLLIGVCQFQNVPVIELGVSFSVCKLVILAGLLRAWRERALAWTTRQPLDVLVAMWACWMILSGFGHNPPDHNPITIRLSVIYDFAGAYLYARSFLKDRDEFLEYARCLALVVGGLALVVLVEKVAHHNLYNLIAGIQQEVTIREGRVRCTGPFGHPILLGTFGAASSVVLLALWRRQRRWTLAGLGACGLVVICSASSSPILTLFSGACAVALWRWRASVGRIRKLIIIGFITLHMVMTAPVWYLMARIDVVGGSTGWHRAELISAAIDHLEEWWLVGTDYTRHWIAYGVPWSKYHIDITNYYIGMGVNGGLLLMLLFISILLAAFRVLGREMQRMRSAGNPDEFVLWCAGSALFAHAFTFLSVSYFDQSNVAVALLLGGGPGLCAELPAVSTASAADLWQHESGDLITPPHQS